MPKWLNWLAEKFISSTMWKKFARHWMAYFTFRCFGWPKFPKSKYFEVKAIAKSKKDQCGLLAFVSVDRFILNYKINHLLTGAKWGHAGYVYWGDDGELRIKQMINSGLNDCYLLDLFGEIDGFALLWIPLNNEKALNQANLRIHRLDTVKDKVDYDFSLQLEPEVLQFADDDTKTISVTHRIKLYCSEYVYTLANGLTPSTKFVLSTVMDHLVFEPDDLYHASEVLFDEIY